MWWESKNLILGQSIAGRGINESNFYTGLLYTFGLKWGKINFVYLKKGDLQNVELFKEIAMSL